MKVLVFEIDYPEEGRFLYICDEDTDIFVYGVLEVSEACDFIEAETGKRIEEDVLLEHLKSGKRIEYE